MLQSKDTGIRIDKNNKTHIHACLKETHFRPKDTCKLKVRGWRNIYCANGHQKKAGIAMLISYKLDFKPKTVTRGEEGHYIIIKGSIQKEEHPNI